MAKIQLSKDAAQRAISYSNDVRDSLLQNIQIMDNNVNAQFAAIKDPSLQKYLQMSDEMQSLLRQVGQKMDAVSEYCRAVMAWMDTYSET